MFAQACECSSLSVCLQQADLTCCIPHNSVLVTALHAQQQRQHEQPCLHPSTARQLNVCH